MDGGNRGSATTRPGVNSKSEQVNTENNYSRDNATEKSKSRQELVRMNAAVTTAYRMIKKAKSIGGWN